MDNSSPELMSPSLSISLNEANVSLHTVPLHIPPLNTVPTTTILIVDDSESDRSTYVRYLQSEVEHLYTIIEAETLEDGLELWRSQSPDIVLLDVKLPDGDGLEFLEYLNEGNTDRRLPVIVLTGQGDEPTAVRAMKLGAADYLEKKDVTAVSLSISLNQVRDSISQIRDRQQVEEQLIRTNEELIRATRLKDEFLANMSHELRTPLTAILGMSEVLQKELLGSVNERQQKALGAIRKGGRHLLELINDILDLSKISSGKMELDLNPISVQNVCDSSLVYVKQQAFQKHVEVYSNIAPNVGNILADERRIRQVLINLLINAVKFTPNGGRVSLLVSVGCGDTWEGEAKVPDLFKNQNLPMLLLQVADTGIGIDPKDMPRLFQPFVQLDSGLNRQYEGTGLGLVMVRQIAELHDGQVTVESVLGEGSYFTVALPYEIAQPTLRSPDLIAPFALPTTKSKDAIAPLILLAEDNEANIQTFMAYLSPYEYRVILAKNGESAVAMATAHQPDIILMDIQMPVIDGLQAIRLIRSDDKLATVPIIALTARAMQGDQERCLEAGANQYLSKPVGLEELVGVIGQFLEI